MKHSERRQALTVAHHETLRLLAGDIDTLVSCLHGHGQPNTLHAHTYDTGPPTSQHGDPTGNAAVNPNTQTARRELDALDADLRLLAELTNRLASRREHWLPHMAATTDTPDPQWCRSCYRHNHRENPTADRYKGRQLCRWCGDWTVHADRPLDPDGLPPIGLVRARLNLPPEARTTQPFIAKHIP